MNKIPKKITPDRIRESIVEIRFSSKYPSEVILGCLYPTLDESYIYEQIAIDVNNTSQTRVMPTFYNDKIKIGVIRSTLVFGCKDRYLGWTDFLHEIKRVLTEFLKTDVIDSYTRIGIRYISDYEDLSLYDNTVFKFSIGFDNIQTNAFEFSTHFDIDGYNANIKLFSREKKSVENNQTTPKASTIDIDVIKSLKGKLDLEELLQIITDTHDKQKELFFGMLTPEFLTTLNPEY